MLLFWGLHFLVVASVCTTDGGCSGDHPMSYWHSPVFTLAGCYVLVDAYEIFFVTWRKIFLQCHLLTVLSTLGRAFLKVVVLGWMLTNYPGTTFVDSARCGAGAARWWALFSTVVLFCVALCFRFVWGVFWLLFFRSLKSSVRNLVGLVTCRYFTDSYYCYFGGALLIGPFFFANIAKYIGFCVHRRSCLMWPLPGFHEYHSVPK